MRRLLYVCLDGLGDDPIPALGGRTPLEAADTPFLDSLAGRGRTGNVITVASGVAPESDIGVFGILGYDPREEHPGRGVLEAVGSGIAFRDGDLAYRVNCATREGHLGVALETFEPVVARAEPLDDSAEAAAAADLTNAFVDGSAGVLGRSPVNQRRRSMGKQPGNLLLTRDGGDHIPEIQPIRDRFGPSWGCFVEMPVERGIALLLGMEAVDAPRLDGSDEAFAAWADLAAEALDGFDALYVHIKGPDVPAHDGRAED